MKVTEKIVTSVTQPQLTNVMWHNPDTGEFKIFGGKGWEPAGGNPGLTGSSFSGGYPVVTVENDFNIEAQPNTFYNIKNTPDNEVNINFKDEEFGGDMDKILVCYFDTANWNGEGTEVLGMAVTILTMGGVFVPSNVDTDFKYEFILRNDSMGIILPTALLLFVSEIPSTDPLNMSSNIRVKMIMDAQVVGESLLPPICIINKDIDYIVQFSLSLGSESGSATIAIPGVVTQELGYDDIGYKYLICVSPMFFGNPFAICYTEVEYTKADKVSIEVSDGSTSSVTVQPITVQSNKGLTTPDEVKEFVFNLKSPANIVLSHPVSWNNGNTPDFTQSGTYTLSILNGVGCYTFT